MSLMGTLSILDGCPKKSFSSAYDIGNQFFGHPSHIDGVPIKLTQFCCNTYPQMDPTWSVLSPPTNVELQNSPRGLSSGLFRQVR